MPLAPYTLEQAEEDIAELRGQMDALLESHTISDGPTPNAPSSSGVTVWSSTGNLAIMNVSGMQGNVACAQTAFTPSNTVTAASLTNLAGGTYKGTDADVGAIYETQVWGNGQGASIGNRQTLQFATILGGTTMANFTFGTTALPDTSAIFRFLAIARVICLTTGPTGTWQSSIFVQLNQFNANLAVGNQNTLTGFSCESTTTTVKDTTADMNVGVSCAWGATTGAPTITSQVAYFGRVC
jgi:hypothetical protein